MKVSSAYHVDGGSAEVIFSPERGKRLYFEDNVPVSDFAIDGVYINGRDATSENVRFFQIFSDDIILGLFPKLIKSFYVF